MTPAKIETLPELLAHALAIEHEAADRYRELADQMEMHHNTEVAELFRKLEAIESKHVGKVETLAEGVELPRLAAWEYQWPEGESSEGPDVHDVHYLMTPYQALELALAGEEKAATFFRDISTHDVPPEVRDAAARLADEEDEHVGLIKEWLSRYPKPDDGWDEDPDPPNQPE